MALAVLVNDFLHRARCAVLRRHPAPDKLEVARSDEPLDVGIA